VEVEGIDTDQTQMRMKSSREHVEKLEAKPFLTFLNDLFLTITR